MSAQDGLAYFLGCGSGSNGIARSLGGGERDREAVERVCPVDATTCVTGFLMMKTFCHGVQTTDENGRIDFDTVFPGWYKGRTIHIHFTIRVSGKTLSIG